VITTLDPHAQRTAIEALGAHEGAVVALDPRTGAVKVMASTPSFDPNSLRSPTSYERLVRQTKGTARGSRVTQLGDGPGSTFNVLTATAAIDTGAFTASSTVSGRNDVPISGVPLQNDNGESLGQITLTEALAKSVNTVWAQVAEQLGKPTMARYMARFGFNRKPRLDFPVQEMSASGEYAGPGGCWLPPARWSTWGAWGSARTSCR
jgi:peptidoglycan glycosyltransferase